MERPLVDPSIATNLLGGAGAILVGPDSSLPDPGAVVSARVVGVRDGHAWLALSGGRVLVATPVPLVVGQQVRVQVVRAPAGQRVVRLVDSAGAAPIGPGHAAAARSAPAPPPALAAGPPLAAHLAAGPSTSPQAPAPPHAAAEPSATAGRSIALSGTDWPATGRATAACDMANLPLVVRPPRGGPSTAGLPPGGSPASASWRDALAALDRLAAQGATSAPTAELAAAALRAWQAESLEAPALARWLQRVVHEIAVPLEAKLAAASAGTSPPSPDAPPDAPLPLRSEGPPEAAGSLAETAPAALPRPTAREAESAARAGPPGAAGAPSEPLAADARGRLALLRAATPEPEARAAFDRLAAQLVGDQTRNALAPPAAGWWFTLPSPGPQPQAPIELRVPPRPAEHAGPEPGARHAVQLRLALPQLGELVVDLLTAGEQAHCRILTSSPFAAALFEATAAELVRALARAGYPRAAVATGVRPPARGPSASAAPAARLDVHA